MKYKRILCGENGAWVAFLLNNDCTAIVPAYANASIPQKTNFLSIGSVLSHNPYAKIVIFSELEQKTLQNAIANIESWPDNTFEVVCGDCDGKKLDNMRKISLRFAQPFID